MQSSVLLPNCRIDCCFPFASASAAGPRLRPLQLLLPDCICFTCWRQLQLLLPAGPIRDCVPLNCSPIASTSAAAPRLCSLQLLLPDCIRFNCCSPIASASTTAPRLHPSCSFQPMPNVLKHSLHRVEVQ